RDVRGHRALGVECPASRRVRRGRERAVRAAGRAGGRTQCPTAGARTGRGACVGAEGGRVSDFTSDGWGFYVTIVTLASIAGCAVLLFALGRMRVTRSKTGGPVETTGHVWDGDLAEYNSPLPRWWMWLFYAPIVFALAYLVLYPGLGRAPGALGWTSAGAYVSEVKAQDEKVHPLDAKYRAMDVKAVAADAEARAMGERLFLNYCAQCHGSDAGGSKWFSSLRDTERVYGGH